jgi:hypothetical protein
MANRNNGAPVLLLIFQAILASGALLYAQDPADQKSDGFRENSIERRFVRRLSWAHHDLVFRYEVILEEERDGAYKELLRESTEENSLNISLRPGWYRYTVEVYNLFRQLEYRMDWVYFTVLNALQPEILTFFPEAFFTDGESPWQITIIGRNIDPEAFFMLRPRDVSREEAGGIRPRNITFEENTALLTFERTQLAPGAYDVFVRNPGGLEDTVGIFEVRERVTAGENSDEPGEKTSRRPDIMISAGYAPAIPLYGGLFHRGAFIQPAFPLGFAVRAGALPLKRHWGYLGAELNAAWYTMKEQSENYTIEAQDIGVYLNLLYQLWLPNRIMAFNFRLGTGLNLVADFYFDYGDGKEDPMTGAYLSLDAGFTFQWRITGPLFLETGLDFIHVFSPNDRFQPGYFRPTLSIGGQFGSPLPR